MISRRVKNGEGDHALAFLFLNRKHALNRGSGRYLFWLDWWRRWRGGHFFRCKDAASSTGTLCRLIIVSVIWQALDLCYSDQVPYFQADGPRRPELLFCLLQRNRRPTRGAMHGVGHSFLLGSFLVQ